MVTAPWRVRVFATCRQEWTAINSSPALQENRLQPRKVLISLTSHEGCRSHPRQNCTLRGERMLSQDSFPNTNLNANFDFRGECLSLRMQCIFRRLLFSRCGKAFFLLWSRFLLQSRVFSAASFFLPRVFFDTVFIRFTRFFFLPGPNRLFSPAASGLHSFYCNVLLLQCVFLLR